MNKTGVEYANYSWNPVSGCYHHCQYCYARRHCARFEGRYFKEIDSNYCVHMTAGQDAALIADDNAQHLYNPESEDGRIFIAQRRPLYTLDEPLSFKTKKGKLIKASYPFGFFPTFHRYRLKEPYIQNRKPGRVFVVDMGDLFGEWVPDEWIQQVFEACERAPWHKYLFLTKNPKRYKDLYKICSLRTLDMPIWLGATAATQESLCDTTYMFGGLSSGLKKFLSIEPIQEELDMPDSEGYAWWFYDWVIIGAETGNRKDKVIPKREWVERILDNCRAAGVPVFMKNNLRSVWGEELIQEYPEGLKI